jgi:glutaconyl-CoA/methylmalonyl-CoA decarboxylase subunit gamma
MKLRVKIDDTTYEVEVGDLSARPILAVVDGETIEVWPEEVQTAAATVPTAPTARPVAPATAAPTFAPTTRAVAANGGERGKLVIAPIPGTIVAIAVKEGDSVNAGQELLSLEAMKMKNAIRATRPGKIAAILVKTGDRVSQGQTLVEYAE